MTEAARIQHLTDFTEDHYRRLIERARQQYACIAFPDYRRAGRLCLWRHDVDFSLHRALRLAEIEAEAGWQATYFVQLNSSFYNLLECQSVRLVQRISALGHEVGLHFDPGAALGPAGLKKRLGFEKGIFEDALGVAVNAFSIHNPGCHDWAALAADEVLGMVNTYGPYLREHFAYCSDSYGYWRYSRLEDVLQRGEPERLHVLTHPAWWVPEPLPPRQRVQRCLEGRLRNTAESYDRFLERAGQND